MLYAVRHVTKGGEEPAMSCDLLDLEFLVSLDEFSNGLVPLLQLVHEVGYAGGLLSSWTLFTSTTG